jgi:hypothetical protein
MAPNVLVFTTRAGAALADLAKCPWPELHCRTRPLLLARAMASDAVGGAQREIAVLGDVLWPCWRHDTTLE